MSTAQTPSRWLGNPTYRAQRHQSTGQPQTCTMDADASCPASATDGSEIPGPVGSNSLRNEQEGLVSASVIDLAEGRRFELAPEWAPDQRLGRFERLLADLSAAFINAPSNQVDAGIRDAQQRIVDALDLDRCTLSVVEDRDLVHSHDWTSPEFLSRASFPPGARVSARELFPWTLAKIQAGELVQFSSRRRDAGRPGSRELPQIRHEIDRDRSPQRRGPTAWRSGIRRRPCGAVLAASHSGPSAVRGQRLCRDAGAPPRRRITACGSGRSVAPEREVASREGLSAKGITGAPARVW